MPRSSSNSPKICSPIGGSADTIKEMSMNLSTAFKKGTAEHLPNARGHRTHKKVINLAYLILDNLNLRLLT